MEARPGAPRRTSGSHDGRFDQRVPSLGALERTLWRLHSAHQLGLLLTLHSPSLYISLSLSVIVSLTLSLALVFLGRCLSLSKYTCLCSTSFPI